MVGSAGKSMAGADLLPAAEVLEPDRGAGSPPARLQPLAYQVSMTYELQLSAADSPAFSALCPFKDKD